MTDLDQVPPTTDAPPDARLLGPPRRRRSRWWWVAAVVVVGALVGVVLGRWDMTHHSTVSKSAATTTTVATNPLIPEGLLGKNATATPPPTHTIDNRVFVVGDSVMQGAAPYLSTDLPTWSIIADTKVGRFLDQANTVIVKRRKDIANIAVLNLGNNYDGNQQEFAQQVTTALTDLSGVEHIIWLNVAEFQDDRTQVNAVLQQAAATHPNLTVVDWNSWWAANRAFTGADHLHLTDEGAHAYAALVAAAVQKVTAAAGEIPAAGVTKPSLNTSGTIPGSRGRSTQSQLQSPSRARLPVRHPVTTLGTVRPGGGVTPSPTAVTAPPSTAPVVPDTAPRSSTPASTTPVPPTVPGAGG